MKRRLMLLVACVAMPVVLFAAGGGSHSKDKAKPQAKAPEEPARVIEPNGYRHWAPFARTAINYDYVTATCRSNETAYYLACVQRAGQETGLISFPPNGERDKNRLKVLFSSKLIDDVLDPTDSKKLAPFIQMARTSMYYDDEAGFACMNSVFPGEYGKWSLVPALFSSRTGEPGTWKYHGKLKGDPAVHENEMKGKRWIGEGSVVRLTNGQWRVYLGGYGVDVAVADSTSLDGPWKFVKDGGKIRNLAAALPVKGTCFPYVLKVSGTEYHLWIAEKWPCVAVWHMTASDGLNFKPYGRQPEIVRGAMGTKEMKCVRAYLDSDGKTIHGLIPFSTGEGWVIYQSTMPAGLQPQ